MGAAALGPLAGAAGDRLGDGQQVVELEDEVPARVERPPAGRPDGRPAPAQLGQLSERLVEIGLDAEDPDEALHRRPGGRAGSRTGPRPRSARAARRARRPPPGPGPGSTYGSASVAAACAAAAAPVRAPNTSRSDSELPPSRLAPCIPPATSPAAYRPATVVAPGLGIDPDAAHDVVGGRPDLHRPLRDVDVGQLLELLVHRRQLAADRLGRQVADVEEDAAVGRAASLADLGVDRARDVVPGGQLGRPPGVGLLALGQRRHPAGGLLVGRRVLARAGPRAGTST